MKKFFYILFIGVFGLLSCSKDDTTGDQGTSGSGGYVAVSAISLNPTSIIIATGANDTIVATTPL